MRSLVHFTQFKSHGLCAYPSLAGICVVKWVLSFIASEYLKPAFVRVWVWVGGWLAGWLWVWVCVYACAKTYKSVCAHIHTRTHEEITNARECDLRV